MTKEKNSSTSLPQFTIKQLLEAGVHFGHKTMRRNPKMSKYIFGDKNDLSIIDLEQTAICLHNALKTVKEIAKNNGRILFIATKKQAFDAVEEAAKRCGQYYVNQRWLGGMLTNWKTISQSIKTLKKIEEQLSNDEIGLNKKERLVLDRQRDKLDKALGGIRNMGGYPDLVFIVDINREALAMAEAKKLGVPIMAILDTNVNPDGVTFPIPGNDDSVKSIKLYCRLLSDAILAGIKENMAIAGVDISKFEGASSDAILEASNSKKSEAKKPEFSKEKAGKEKEKFAKPAVKKDEEEPSEEVAQKAEPKESKPAKPTADKKADVKKKPAAKAPAKKTTKK
ncbi:MAG: rpsB [Rickettsiaceae bacterium]|jgi:small subunit ribosomal protein S2|nr:rpsB [Rickettsiaceae bacterium]